MIKVVYDWIVKGDDEFNQKMNVSMASEELPDVMCVTADTDDAAHRRRPGAGNGTGF